MGLNVRTPLCLSSLEVRDAAFEQAYRFPICQAKSGYGHEICCVTAFLGLWEAIVKLLTKYAVRQDRSEL